MIRMTRISIAVACAVGMSAAFAQSVQRADKVVSDAATPTQAVAQASSAAPIRTAQAGAGGAAGGASTTGATAAGLSTPAIVAIGAAAAVVAISANNSSTTGH